LSQAGKPYLIVRPGGGWEKKQGKQGPSKWKGSRSMSRKAHGQMTWDKKEVKTFGKEECPAIPKVASHHRKKGKQGGWNQMKGTFRDLY